MITPLPTGFHASLPKGHHRVSEEVKEGDCRGGWELLSNPGTLEETIPEGQAGEAKATGRR
jgi:hypothetical protein